MRRSLSISIAAVALLAAAAAVRAGDPPAAEPPESPADALFKRLVSGRATDRVKADADLATADRDTLAAVAKRLRDEFAPPPGRVTTTSRGVNVEIRWIDMRPDLLCSVLGADPCASDPVVVHLAQEKLYPLIERSIDVQQITASKITVFDRQKATVEVLNQKTGTTGRATGVVVGIRPAVAEDGKSLRLDVTAETRRNAGAMPSSPSAVVGASWRSEVAVPADADVVVVFPAAYRIEHKDDPSDWRVVLVLHAEVIDLGPETIGALIQDFEPSFDPWVPGAPGR
jgi:hypothetical protein